MSRVSSKGAAPSSSAVPTPRLDAGYPLHLTAQGQDALRAVGKVARGAPGRPLRCASNLMSGPLSANRSNASPSSRGSYRGPTRATAGDAARQEGRGFRTAKRQKSGTTPQPGMIETEGTNGRDPIF